VLLLPDFEGYVRFVDVVLDECFAIGPYFSGFCVRRFSIYPLAPSSVGIVDICPLVLAWCFLTLFDLCASFLECFQLPNYSLIGTIFQDCWPLLFLLTFHIVKQDFLPFPATPLHFHWVNFAHSLNTFPPRDLVLNDRDAVSLRSFVDLCSIKSCRQRWFSQHDLPFRSLISPLNSSVVTYRWVPCRGVSVAFVVIRVLIQQTSIPCITCSAVCSFPMLPWYFPTILVSIKVQCRCSDEFIHRVHPDF
jgi:hypothetical protein